MSVVELEWLPPPRDFRAELASAVSQPEVTSRLGALRRLATTRLSAIEAILLARALPGADEPAPEGMPRVRLALLDPANVDHLVPFVRVAFLRHGLVADVYVPGYGQWRQDLAAPASPLSEFKPDVVVFGSSSREALVGVAADVDASAVDRRLDDVVGEFAACWRAAREKFAADIVQTTALDVGEPLFGGLDRQVPASPSQACALLNDRLARRAAVERVMLVDLARAAARDGRDVWHDPARWYQAKQEIALTAAPAFADLLARVVAARRGLSRKCLVLDLDNTLWGGVVGDDGLEGIVLGQGSALGEAHLALQRYALALRQRGVLLAVCSKNDPEVAAEAVASHPEMLLRPEHFAAFRANWEDKAANLREIARDLNLGLDALVFVDDSARERARVREALPEVAVPELPDDPVRYVRCVARAGYFEAISFTAEDVARADTYRDSLARDTFRATVQSVDEFLAGLAMEARVAQFTTIDANRLFQLINKTNQFNLTLRRHGLEQVLAFMSDPGCITLQCRLRDRFGDNGLVAAMVLRSIEDGGAFVVDTWVMSCRVFGRRLEHETLNAAVEEVRSRGGKRVVGEFVPGARNGPFRNLYDELGFDRVPAADDASTVRWSLSVAGFSPMRTHIRRERQ